jgi:uncharacterized protein (TIGR03435 family)
MPQLARFASNLAFHCPVLDRTELTGLFDYRSSTEEDWDSYSSNSAGSFLSFIKEMGLKMQPAQGPIETFVIDHAELSSPS